MAHTQCPPTDCAALVHYVVRPSVDELICRTSIVLWTTNRTAGIFRRRRRRVIKQRTGRSLSKRTSHRKTDQKGFCYKAKDIVTSRDKADIEKDSVRGMAPGTRNWQGREVVQRQHGWTTLRHGHKRVSEWVNLKWMNREARGATPRLKTREWKTRHQLAGLEKAGISDSLVLRNGS